MVIKQAGKITSLSMGYSINLLLFAIFSIFALITSEGPILETPQGTLQGISLRLEDGNVQLNDYVVQ